MAYFSFSLLIGGGTVLAHAYLYRRLLRPLDLGRRLNSALLIFLAVMTGLLVLRGPLRGSDPELRAMYEIVSYSWLAVVLCMLPATVAGDGLALAFTVGRRVRRVLGGDKPPAPADLVPTDGDAIDPGRRQVARAIPLAVLGTGAASIVFGTARAFTPAEISEVPVALPRLPRTLDGLSIVQLTDIHVGNFIGHSFVKRLVDQTNALKPDVIAVTGDLVDGDVKTLGHAVSALGALQARYGVYFVTGNHEYHSDADAWVAYLRKLGITVLRNQRVPIGDSGGTLDLVGVDDWGGRQRRRQQGYDLDVALGDRDPDRAAVLLAHQPQNFAEAAARGMGLQISGHTHGGQVFPMTVLVGLGFEYTRGLYREGDNHIYVSRGCGFWGPPARLGSAPEIVKFTLTT